jgi:ribonuclease P protein component
VHGELFLVMLLAGSSETRVGITVSSKVGNSVVRNRIKRWVREYVRRHRAELPAGADLVVVAKAPAATATHEAVDRDMARLLERARA